MRVVQFNFPDCVRYAVEVRDGEYLDLTSPNIIVRKRNSYSFSENCLTRSKKKACVRLSRLNSEPVEVSCEAKKKGGFFSELFMFMAGLIIGSLIVIWVTA